MSLFASTLCSVAGGILANAALSGANTVMPLALFSVSTRPAALTAATKVDSTGLADAAVATGTSAMPVKLPAPVLGTAEHAEPNGAALVVGAAFVVAGVPAEPVLLLPQAAKPASATAATAPMAMRLNCMGFLLRMRMWARVITTVVLRIGGGCWPVGVSERADRGMGARSDESRRSAVAGP